MTVVNLDIRKLTPLGSLASTATVVIDFVQGNATPVLVDGAKVTFPERIEQRVTGAASINVPATGTAMAAHWSIVVTGGIRLDRYTLVPTTGPIDFEDLAQVDPDSFAPAPAPPTIVESVVNAVRDEISDVSSPIRGDLEAVIDTATAPARTLRATMRPFSGQPHPTAAMTYVANAGAILGTSPVAALWNDFAKVTYYAGAPVEAVAGSPLQGAAMKGSGSNAPQSLYASWTITGDVVGFMVNAWAACDVVVFVDRMPAAVGFTVDAAGQWFVIVQGLGAGAHDVDFMLGWGASLIQVLVPQGQTISPGPAPEFKLWLTGDSYAHSGIAPFYGGLAAELHRLTGWAIGQGGQGSTGYTNDGHSSGDLTKSAFLSPQRIAALEAFDPDLVLVIGSVNDGAADPSTVFSLAVGFAFMLGGRPLIAAGVEPLYAADDPTYAAWDVVNAAIMSGLTVAPNLLGLIDWRTEDWLTGTGSVSAPKGDGLQDYLIGDQAGIDTIHLNLFGQKYIALRLVERIATLPWE